MSSEKIVFDLIKKEKERQLEGIELIASENFTSENVMLATGSVLTNKYAEQTSPRCLVNRLMKGLQKKRLTGTDPSGSWAAAPSSRYGGWSRLLDLRSALL